MHAPRRILLALVVAVLALSACGDDDTTDAVSGDPSAGDASVEITSPADGDEVTSPVTIEMSATDFTIEPAGEVADGAGHFHLMLDVDCVEVGEIIPSDDGHVHFGKAQTEAEIELEPGEHTICLQVGDGLHTALGLTDVITITVVE